MQKLTVNIDNAGSRLDKFLAKNGCGFVLAQKLLRQGKVKVNGERKVASFRLGCDDEVIILGELVIGQGEEGVRRRSVAKVSEEKLDLIKKSIIFKDDNVIVIDKPAGIAVQAGNRNDFSIDVALSYLKFEREELPRLVHRLDRDTSGILLLARNRKAAELLSDGFRNKTIRKTYVAWVVGCVKKREGIIDLPLLKKVFGNTKKVSVDGEGREAVTHYRVLEIYDGYSLLELKPITGRMHQLRVHCREIGHPIIGDRKYGKGSVAFGRDLGINRLCLHSSRVEMENFFGEKMVVNSELSINLNH